MDDVSFRGGHAVGFVNDSADEHVVGRLGGEDKLTGVNLPSPGFELAAAGYLQDRIGLGHTGGRGKFR